MGEEGVGQGLYPKSFICLWDSLDDPQPSLPAILPWGALPGSGSRAPAPCPGAVGHGGLDVEDAPSASKPEEVKNS